MTDHRSQLPKYRGRFAPSPTGPLHFGSLVTAVASYLETRAHNGEWLVRIEDLDSTRVVPGASKRILHVLEALGMYWDGEVIYQSQRLSAYETAMTNLGACKLIYPCICSRKEIADSAVMGVEGPVYPGVCRNGFTHHAHASHSAAMRIRTDNSLIEFVDRLQGNVRQCVESEVGDFVLRRADGIYTYQLAVVVDDAWQDITHIVRGSDLLLSTPRQIYLQKLLGFSTPGYLHLPVVVNEQGKKLSKQTQASPIDLSNPLSQLVSALNILGQAPPGELMEGDLSSFWRWAIENWQVEKIPKESCILLNV